MQKLSISVRFTESEFENWLAEFKHTISTHGPVRKFKSISNTGADLLIYEIDGILPEELTVLKLRTQHEYTVIGMGHYPDW